MARYRHEGYTLLARRRAGAWVWHYRWYDADGIRRGPKSTGIGYTSERDRARTKRQAAAYCDELLGAGRLGGSAGAWLTLSAWVASVAFWDWNQSTYVRSILDRSPADRPGITEAYVRDAERIWSDRIQPHHGHLQMRAIRADRCERLLLDTWRATGRSSKTLNNWRAVYSAMMAEASRLGVIEANPWERVPALTADSKPRGGLTLQDGARLLSPAGLDLSKRATRLYWTATRLALLAGLRIGEVCGLQTDDVAALETDAGAVWYLHVRRQYNPKVARLTPTKDKDQRAVPLVAAVAEDLAPYLAIGPGRYLLSFDRQQRTPLAANRLRGWYNARLVELQISAPGATFHSCRRFFNTLLRRRVSDDVLRKMTGHDGAAMTEHYTDYLPADLQAIAAAQAIALSGSASDRE